MTSPAISNQSRFVVTGLALFGVYSTLLGLFMLFAPGAFYESLGAFGPRNNHYIFDNASFELPLGLLLLAAIRRPGWRTPSLAFATAHWLLHTVSHVIDTNHAAGHQAGITEATALALGTVWLATTLRCSIRDNRGPKFLEDLPERT